MAPLINVRIAVLAMDGFEESELTTPVKELLEAGAAVDIVSEKKGKIQGFKHFNKSLQVPVDRILAEVNSNEYQGLILPGGALNADYERTVEKALDFVRAFQKEKKPIAAICHAPWVLISAGLVKGRTLTSYFSIQDDIKNAGGNWVDQEVVRDRNWITSRQPSDLKAFCRETIHLIADSLLGKAPPRQAEALRKFKVEES